MKVCCIPNTNIVSIYYYIINVEVDHYDDVTLLKLNTTLTNPFFHYYINYCSGTFIQMLINFQAKKPNTIVIYVRSSIFFAKQRVVISLVTRARM